MFTPMAIQDLTPEQLEAARSDAALRRLFFKMDSEGTDYTLVNFLDEEARAAVRRLDHGLAERIEAAAELLTELDGARDTLIDLEVWEEA